MKIAVWGDDLRVRDVMHRQFDMIDGKATIAQALAEMEHQETKALIVDRRQSDDEYGMLLISDIARKVLAKNRAPDRVNVYEVMARPVLSVRANMKVRHCARLLDQFNVTRAPVIENDEVVGIVSLTGLVLRGLDDVLG